MSRGRSRTVSGWRRGAYQWASSSSGIKPWSGDEWHPYHWHIPLLLPLLLFSLLTVSSLPSTVLCVHNDHLASPPSYHQSISSHHHPQASSLRNPSSVYLSSDLTSHSDANQLPAEQHDELVQPLSPSSLLLSSVEQLIHRAADGDNASPLSLSPRIDPVSVDSQVTDHARRAKQSSEFANTERPQASVRPNSKDLSRNQPSSMDDIIGGLLQLMGGNMKLPLGGGGSNDQQKLASLLAASQQRLPPHLAPLLHRPPLPNGPPGSGFHNLPPRPNFIPHKFPLYQIPFIPLPGGNNGRGPTIPLNSNIANNQSPVPPLLPPKLPPNLPPLQGLTKAEMDNLYQQFLAQGGGAALANKTIANNLLSNFLQMSNNNKVRPEPSKVVGELVTPTPFLQSDHGTMSKSLTSSSGGEPQIITMGEEPSVFEMVVKHKIGPTESSELKPTAVTTTHEPSYQTKSPVAEFTEIRNQHSQQHQMSLKVTSPSKTTDIVYGKRITPLVKTESTTIEPSFTTTAISAASSKSYYSPVTFPTEASTSISAYGKPMIMAVPMDSEVRPKIAAVIEPTRTIDGSRFLSQPTKSMMSTDSKRTNQIPSASGGSNATKPKAKPFVRRPQFRPRPNVPIVRIDTCIVGDDSTCDVSLNEKCLTELGLSSCQCRPGFARQIPRTACVPVISVALSFRVDKIGNNRVQFTKNLLNSNSEEYQYLEFESIHALNSMFTSTKSLEGELMAVKINRFYSMGGKTIVNATINLRNNDTSFTNGQRIKRMLQHELTETIAEKQGNLGESQLWVESASNAVTRVDDLNECASQEHNDCSKHARCFNEFGGFRCECEAGYEDKNTDDRLKTGRVCTGCSPQYCSNRGECLIVKGERVCKCRANFIGAQCDIDGEVVGIAVFGTIAALIIIVITFICLYMWNQRFKREQQKIEAMSAASGHTFSYMNKHGPSGPPTVSRMSIDERYGRSWANHYSDSQQHLLSSSGYFGMGNSEHQTNSHVYAQPVRVIANATTDAPYDTTYGHDYNTRASAGRSLKVKNNRDQRSNGTLHYPYGLKSHADTYNETEFSTRELIYSPAHLYATNPRSYY